MVPCPLPKCDFAEVTIERGPVGPGKKYKQNESGEWVEKEPSDAPYSLKLSAILANARPPLIQILAGPEAPGVIGSVTGIKSTLAIRKVKVSTSLAEGPCGRHPNIKITGGRNPLEYIGPGQCASITFDVYRNEGLTFNEKLGFSLASVWPCKIAPRLYSITSETCGGRSSGKVIKGNTVAVEVFPCEQYALNLRFPAFKNGSYKIERTETLNSKGRVDVKVSEERTSKTGFGSSKEGSETKSSVSNNAAGSTLENTRSKTQGSKTSTLKTTYEADGQIANEMTSKQGDTDSVYSEGKYGSKQWILSGRSAPADQVVFELFRSGATENLGGDVVKLLNWLLYTRSELESLKDNIKNFMPQLGASFDFNFSFLEGSFSASWGYQEYVDYRVYFAWEVVLAMKLLSVTLSASIGFQLSALITAKLQLDVTGDVSANIKRARSKPEQPMMGEGGSAAIEGLIEGKLSGVAQVGVGWCKVSREVGAKSGYKVGAVFSVTEGEFALKGSAQFIGVFAYITKKDLTEPEVSDLYEIIGEGKEHSFNLPTPPPMGDFERSLPNGKMYA